MCSHSKYNSDDHGDGDDYHGALSIIMKIVMVMLLMVAMMMIMMMMAN